ncbi:MAG: hypothetical protein K6G31_06980 [Paludibacteraceae bacterium]|nr:hypothetical protein [Paludibacteraceae bacterium]
MSEQTVELSFTGEKGFIMEVISVIADFFTTDSDELLTNAINGNCKLKAISDVVQRQPLTA